MVFDDLYGLAGERTTTKGKKTPWFVLNSPELGKPFADFCESCKCKGVLDKKMKELLTTALACVFRSEHRMEEHIKGALEAGASREEITEALLMVSAEYGIAQVYWLEDLCSKHLSEHST